MRLRVERHGGIAGIPMTAEVDTAELGDEAAARAEQAWRELGTRGDAAPSAGADRFVFRLTRLDGDRASATVPEPDVPVDLHPLVTLVHERGRPAPPAR